MQEQAADHPPVTADPEPASASPGSLIVTFAGLHLRELGGWIPVADLVAVLEQAGQPAAATRTDAGRADLEIGDARIFRYGQAPESAGWVLAVFSVPESARAERHRLRARLSWLGFGTVAAGVWIAPATLADRARDQLGNEGLGGYISWFSAEPLQAADVARWWNLDALRSLYSAFLHQWSTVDPPLLAGDRDAVAFATHLQLSTSCRWVASCSERWRPAADRFVSDRIPS
jgi:phenylacetic acid degradation operon negative regulatory protein